MKNYRGSSKGIPAIIGEFGALERVTSSDLSGTDLILHNAARSFFFHKKVLDTPSKGLKPIYWNIPGKMFDWTATPVMARCL